MTTTEVRAVIAAIVTTQPCTFPSGGFTKAQRRSINDPCRPEDIRDEVVRKVERELRRAAIEAESL